MTNGCCPRRMVQTSKSGPGRPVVTLSPAGSSTVKGRAAIAAASSTVVAADGDGDTDAGAGVLLAGRAGTTSGRVGATVATGAAGAVDGGGTATRDGEAGAVRGVVAGGTGLATAADIVAAGVDRAGRVSGLGSGATAAGAGAGVAMTAEGGAAFRLRVMSLPGRASGGLWVCVWPDMVIRAARNRASIMGGTIAPQPMNGKLLNT